MKRKGYSLIELLVVLVLILVIGGIIFSLLVKTFRTFATSAGEVKKELETSINTDILVFDIKHAGFGINRSDNLVIRYMNSNKTLRLYETINVLNLGRFSFLGSDNKHYFFEVIYNHNRVYPTVNIDADRHICVFLNSTRDVLLGGNYDNCNRTDLSSDIYIGYPIDNETPPRYACRSAGDPDCCSNQYCISIKWSLEDLAADEFPNCVARKKLVRDYSNAPSTPVINCVSDWAAWFGLGDNGTDTIKCWKNDIPPADTSCEIINNNKDLAQKLKAIRIYMLVQASYSADPNYDFCSRSGVKCDNSGPCGDGKIWVDTLVDADGNSYNICLNHPSGNLWRHYRWRLVEITLSGFPNIPQ